MSSVRALERRETANSWPHGPRRHRQHDRTGGKRAVRQSRAKIGKQGKKEKEGKPALTGRCEDFALAEARFAGLVFPPLFRCHVSSKAPRFRRETS